MLHPPVAAVRDAVARALAEDLTPLGDLSAAVVPAGARVRGTLVARAAGVVAGTACVTETFRQLDGAVAVCWAAEEGAQVAAGTALGAIEGPLAPILTGERTALNFLGHLSGVATTVRAFVEAAGGRIGVWDTRKTTPGLRALEKAAVRAGGGRNHRGSLSEWVMLKDNHLAGIGITAGVARARELWPGRTVHVECDHFEQVLEAVEAGADTLLLDNMSPDEVRRCVAAVHERAGGERRPLLEVSGGVRLADVAAYASTGADMISSGGLTNAAPALDVGLDLEVGSGAVGAGA